MTTIYLIRHAEAEGNLYRRIHGWYDALVTENGLRQIQALEQRFQGEHFDAVWSSDLYRTCTTARAVYEPRGLELRTDPELRELNMGDWEDQTWGQVRRTQPGELDRFNRSDPTWTAPRGEGLGELGERVERALRRIAAAHPDQTVAVFSHGTAIRQALARIKGIPPEEWHGLRHSDNTAVSCLKWDGAAFQLAFEGDNSHLDPAISTLARQSWWRRDGKRAEDVNLWFRPLDLERESQTYYEARLHCGRTPWGVTCAMAGGPDGGADPAGPRAVCQGRGRLYPILLHCAPAAGPGAGGAAHRAGGVLLPPPGAAVSAPALCQLQHPRPALLSAVRLL